MQKKERALSVCLGILLFLLITSAEGSGQTVLPFVEPDDGRAPLTRVFDGATQSIDLYVFELTLMEDDEILNSIRAAVRQRGVTARALLEPCPGEGATCDPPNPDARRACGLLKDSGVAVKWANPAFPKTHAKSILVDDNKALVVSLNLVPRTFSDTRDYGVVTNDSGVVEDLSRVFTQDWQDDDPIADCSRAPERTPDTTVQDYPTLVVTPDNGRERMIGLIRSAQTSLKIQMEKIDPQPSRGILPALLEIIGRGVRVQVLLKEGDSDNVLAAQRINEAGGEARLQSQPRLHAKMIIVDDERVFVGSQNLTRDSLDFRREIGWVTTDAATLTRFEETFDSDWVANAPPE